MKKRFYSDVSIKVKKVEEQLSTDGDVIKYNNPNIMYSSKLKNNIVENAAKAISKKVNYIEDTTEQLKNNVIGYTDDIRKQEIIIFILGLSVLTIIFFSPILIDYLSCFDGLSFNKVLPLLSMYAIALYLTVLALRAGVRMNLVSKMNIYIGELNAIKKNLLTHATNIEKEMTEILSLSEKENIKLNFSDVDEDVSKIKNSAKTYLRIDEKVFDIVLKITYYLASILFCSSFVLITFEAVADGVYNSLEFDVDFAVTIYIIIALVVFFAVHFLLHKLSQSSNFGTLALSLCSGPIAMPATWAVCGLIIIVIKILAVIAVIAIILLVLAVIGAMLGFFD